MQFTAIKSWTGRQFNGRGEIAVKLEMWADAHRDGRPAEYRWRRLRKFRNSIPCTTAQSLAHARCWSAVH